MWPILHDRWTNDVPFTPVELAQRVSDHVRPERTLREHLTVIFRKETDPRPFEGRVSGDHFKIHRVINYRNSFLPEIKGVWEPTEHGSRVKITLGLHPIVAVFMLLWVAGVGAGTLVPLFRQTYKGEFFPLAAIPCGMLLFLAVLSITAFEIERRKARRLLDAILDPSTFAS